jgi:hypothetical protein
MTEPRRWTVYRYGDFDWHLGAAPGAEVVEVMPVSEHEKRLREWEIAYDILTGRLHDDASTHEALMSEAYTALATGEHEYEALREAARTVLDTLDRSSSFNVEQVDALRAALNLAANRGGQSPTTPDAGGEGS